MKKSTLEEILAVQELVEDTETRCRELLADGKKIHFIWDVDHCLVSGRSHDVFEITGYDVQKFQRYEERQFLQILGNGPWTRFATKRGWLFDSHDIVTARAAFPALRVMAFCIARNLMPMREMLFVGNQPKTESYRALLRDFVDKPDWHVFIVDDSPRHIADFCKVVGELNENLDEDLGQRFHPIHSPRIRHYTKDELRAHYLNATLPLDSPYYSSTGVGEGRSFLITPNPYDRMRRMFMEERSEARSEAQRGAKRGFDAIVEANRRANEELQSLKGPTVFFRRLEAEEAKRATAAPLEANRHFPAEGPPRTVESLEAPEELAEYVSTPEPANIPDD